MSWRDGLTDEELSTGVRVHPVGATAPDVSLAPEEVYPSPIPWWSLAKDFGQGAKAGYASSVGEPVSRAWNFWKSAFDSGRKESAIAAAEQAPSTQFWQEMAGTTPDSFAGEAGNILAQTATFITEMYATAPAAASIAGPRLAAAVANKVPQFASLANKFPRLAKFIIEYPQNFVQMYGAEAAQGRAENPLKTAVMAAGFQAGGAVADAAPVASGMSRRLVHGGVSAALMGASGAGDGLDRADAINATIGALMGMTNRGEPPKNISRWLVGQGVTGTYYNNVILPEVKRNNPSLAARLARTPLELTAAGQDTPLKQDHPVVKDRGLLSSESGTVSLRPIADAGKWIYDTGQTWLTRHGGVGTEAHKIWMDHIGRNVWESGEADYHGSKFIKWAKKASESDRATASLYLRGKVPLDDVPEQVRPIVDSMRKQLDTLQQEYVDSMPNATPEGRRQKMQEIVADSLGSYLRRKYMIFDKTSEWVPDEKAYEDMRNHIRKSAATELKSDSPNSEALKWAQMSDADIDASLTRVIMEIKSNGGEFPSGSRARTNEQPWMKRKDVPDVVRKFFGEISDPVKAWRLTVQDLAWRTANQKMQTEMARSVSKSQAEIDAMGRDAIGKYEKLSGKTWGDLDGKYVPVEVKELLTRVNSTPSDVRQAWEVIRAVVTTPFKWTKTVGNVPTGHMRQFLGNVLFSPLADTHILNPANATYYAKALKILMNKYNDPQNRQIVKEMVEHNKLETEWFGNEVWRETDRIFEGPGGATQKMVRISQVLNKWQGLPGLKQAGKAYGLPDQWFKIAAYLKHRPKGMENALEKVDMYPNFSDLPRLTQVLRDVPVFGHFVSFKSEALRIAMKYAGQAAKDAKDGRIGAALWKATNIALMIAGPAAAQQIIKGMGGLSDNTDKMLKLYDKYGPNYRRHSQMVAWDNKKTGGATVFDPGFIIPIGDYVQTAKSIIAGDPTYLENVFMSNVYSDTYYALKGVDSRNTNKRTYYDVDSAEDKMLARAKSVGKLFAPPAYFAVREWIRADQGKSEQDKSSALRSILGLRVSRIDFEITKNVKFAEMRKQLDMVRSDARAKAFKAERERNTMFKNAGENKQKAKAANDEFNQNMKMIEQEALARVTAISDIINDVSKMRNNPIQKEKK